MTTQPDSSVSYDSSPLSTRDLRRDLQGPHHPRLSNRLRGQMKCVLGVAVALMVVMPAVALAQSPGPTVVELGTQVSKRTSGQPAQSTPPPAAWRRVKPGREVWVTTNTGSLVHGKVAAISDSSLNIREQDREVTIRLDDVRLVEGRDDLKNGFLIGGASGAAAGGVLFGWLSSAICEYECNGVDGGAVLLGAAGGLAVGGLLGVMVDGLIPGRQTLFGSSTTIVTPVITPTGKAVNVAIRWR
jgi:hypothetical protein